MTTLFRPVGLDELSLIWDSGMAEFPPRLPHQPIFPARTARCNLWSGWQELNLRETCAQDMWVAATLHPDMVSASRVERDFLAFQTSTLTASVRRPKLWWTRRESNSHRLVAGQE